jgi:hypothetical protein
MAEAEKNFAYQTYVDDNGVSWNLRSNTESPAAGVDGHAVGVESQPIFVRTKKQQPRTITYQDATTGRTIRPVFFTSAAYLAVAKGDTVAVPVKGLATTVTYTEIKKNPEKMKSMPAFSTHLAE